MTTVLTAPEQAPPGHAPETRRRPPRDHRLTATFVAAVATALSTVAVASLLSGIRWQSHALGSILLVLVVGVVGRSLRLPRPGVIGAQVLACVAYVTALYAGAEAVLGFIPGKAAVERLTDRYQSGSATMDRAVPPFTADNDVAFVMVLGVAATAIAVDALFVAYRRTLLAGVPLLTLYALPALTLPEGPRSWLFGLPALALLLLFVGDDRERLRRWGLMSDSADLAHAGARSTSAQIGLAVLTITLVLSWAAPKVSAGLFQYQGFGQNKQGPIITLDPLVEMRRELIRPADVDLIKIDSDTARASEQYLRAVTLDEFNGHQWRASDRSLRPLEPDLPPVPGLSPAIVTTPVESTLTGLDAFRTDYLPMPYPSTRLVIDGNWRVDPATANVLSADGREQASGRAYQVSSLDLEPSRSDVGDADPDPSLQRYLELPDLPAKVSDTARKVASGAQGPLEIGLKLQRWFRNPENFAYDLRTPQGSGSDAIVDFLKARRGYCEQFASTMAVMARSLGVPARVSVGFTAGESHPDGRTISAHDAHAWPELWLPNVGWTRFEPTPGNANSGPTVPLWLQDATAQVAQDEAAKAAAADEASGKNDAKDEPKSAEAPPPPPPAQSEPPPPGDSRTIGGIDPQAVDCYAGARETIGCDSQTSVKPPGHLGTILFWVGLGVLLLLLLLAAPWFIRTVQRRRRWKAMAAAGTSAVIAEIAWIELRDTALDLGYVWPPARTPRQTASTLIRDAWLNEAAAASLTGVTKLVEAARYSADGGGSADAAAVRSTVEDVGVALGIAAGRDERIKAKVLPRSLRTSLLRPAWRRVSSPVRGAFRRVARRPA